MYASWPVQAQANCLCLALKEWQIALPFNGAMCVHQGWYYSAGRGERVYTAYSNAPEYSGSASEGPPERC